MDPFPSFLYEGPTNPGIFSEDFQPWDDIGPMFTAGFHFYQALEQQRCMRATKESHEAHIKSLESPFEFIHGGDPRPTQHERFQNMKRGRDEFEGKEEETTSLPAQPTPPKRRHVISGATAAERAVKMMFGRPSQYGGADDSSLDMKSLNSIHEIDSSSSDVAEADESSSQGSESSDDSESTEAAVDRAAGGRMSEDFWTPEETALLDRQARSLHKPASVLDYLKTSPLQSMLPDFLAKMEAANAELEAERAAGTLKQRELELGDEESNENYIEMNLGLGVLEEKADTTDSSGDDSSDGSNILEKLKDVRRGKLDEAETRALIEEI